MAGYSPVSRFLHYLALGVPAIADASFDLEWATQGRSAPDSQDGAHVFICGLARAGTTILMRTLYASGEFCSLTYRDMPFLLAPNLWRRMTGWSQNTARPGERAHQDGILIDFDSPEALDEVFWRIRTRGRYVRAACLTEIPIDQQIIADFRNYVSLIEKKYGARRYLSKNNNNVLRIRALLEAFPRAVVIVPFRDPLQHALSLLTQHQRFSALQRDDPFVRRYMNWLVHHEFGLDYKPFEFGGGAASEHGPEDVRYWLRQWMSVYGAMQATRNDVGSRVLLFDYDRFCDRPDSYLGRLGAELNVTNLRADGIRAPQIREFEFGDTALLDRARELHRDLTVRSLEHERP